MYRILYEIEIDQKSMQNYLKNETFTFKKRLNFNYRADTPSQAFTSGSSNPQTTHF